MIRIICCAFLMLTGCTTFNGIGPVVPEVGFKAAEVNSANPVLEWAAPENYDGQYDLVILTRGVLDQWSFKQKPLQVVYEKIGLEGNLHQVEKPLNHNYMYYWSVKRSDKSSDEDWAKYNYYLITGIVNHWRTDNLFRFQVSLNESASSL